MATKIEIGDIVYVPISQIKNYSGLTSSSLVRGEIVSVKTGTVTVKIYGQDYKSISKKHCHRDICVLLLTIGDFMTEDDLLDPLRKSALSYFRLLLSDNQIMAVKVRTLEELRIYWKKNSAAVTHVVIIGHGDMDGIMFADISENNSYKTITANEFMSQFQLDSVTPKTFINLSCYSGDKKFGSPASSFEFCENLICPYRVVHGAIASQFLQTFFAFHLLEGNSVSVAFKNARKISKSFTSFRRWQNGKMNIENSKPKSNK